MRKRRFGNRRKNSQDMVLQITAMADIFTILLVFLLKSFSTGATTLAPTANMVLPDAPGAAPPSDTLRLEIARDMIVLDDKKISSLDRFQFDPADIQANGIPKSLTAAFSRQRQKDTLHQYPRITVMADRDTPYGTIKRVLASAAYSGFEGFKLLVVEDR